MEKSVDFVVEKYKLAASLSIIALASFLASLVGIAAVGGDSGGKVGEMVIGCIMAVFLFSSFLAMLISTVGVARNRAQLADWGMFLIFIWFVPYLGITFYVGPVAVHRMLRSAN
jgi:hypothetical protein